MAEDPIALGLPHREPFIFVDRVVTHVPGESAEAVKVFPAETPFFAGHFPGAPLVPGVILAEALAQTAGLAAGQPGKSFRLAALPVRRCICRRERSQPWARFGSSM
jgi:3-hydroxyacyl-[acyl-carrier-protein] dehydratase